MHMCMYAYIFLSTYVGLYMYIYILNLHKLVNTGYSFSTQF